MTRKGCPKGRQSMPQMVCNSSTNRYVIHAPIDMFDAHQIMPKRVKRIKALALIQTTIYMGRHKVPFKKDSSLYAPFDLIITLMIKP